MTECKHITVKPHFTSFGNLRFGLSSAGLLVDFVLSGIRRLSGLRIAIPHPYRTDSLQAQRAVSPLYSPPPPWKSHAVPSQWYKSAEAKLIYFKSGLQSFLLSVLWKLIPSYLHMKSLLRLCLLGNLTHDNSLSHNFCRLWNMMGFPSWMWFLLKCSGDYPVLLKASTLATGQLKTSFVLIHH